MGRAFVIFRPYYTGFLLLIMLAGLDVTPSNASPPAVIQPFFGRFEGKTISRGDGETTNRDLSVVIQPDGDRFRVEWTTVTRQVDGELKHKTYSIGFEPSQRPGIFRSTMRTDMFGNQVPLDPLKGDPYVWCHVAGRVMTLYSLQITDDGGYDLQTYERTLEGDLMSLHFTRLREGNEPKELTATLQRVPAVGKPN